jgi:glycosyltransferase involved in cell wall biosynthesis
MVAHTVAARLRVPWVADIRDIWADNPYDEFDQMPAWLQQLNRWLERRTLRTAAGLATVTPPMTRHYKALFPMPIETIYNGYDPQDFVGLSEEVVTPDRYLTLGYAGSIYTGRRDPTPLFQALKLMGAEAENIRVVFCGTEPTHVRALAGQCGVEHLIELRPSIPYKESLRFQRNCDALLLLMWNDVREEGVAPGKLFEYVASLRPILMIGYEKSVAANIIGERSAGLCSNDPSEIAARLRTWLAQKQGSGRLPSLPVSAREGLSRDIQYERLEHFLVKSAGG